ncbi:MAG: hypothetical protein AB7F86_18405 [Bdellovibrionales bacterium]
MQKKSVISNALISFLGTLFLNSAWAGDLEWSGVYRIEGNFLNNSELSGTKKELTYGLHHLVLRPKIVAGDGLTIMGQFDILNDSTNYPDSQMGQVWGSGIGGATPTSENNSNRLSQRQKADTIAVTQLYLTLAQEYGSLIVGRAPLQFGLGMTHNAGRGLFDHWYDTRDLVGYKFIVGNLYFLPMFGKPNEGTLNNTDDTNDYMIHFQYENPETDIQLGVFYQLRKGGTQGSDAPAADPLGGTGATAAGSTDMKTVSVFALRDSDTIRLGAEAAFQSGESGVHTTGGDNVAFGGFGVAGEFEYKPRESNWAWALRAGHASGDDPNTDAKFEGYIFDRNYDVAMLMFNHPLGKDDFLRTKLTTGTVFDNTTDKNHNVADVEALSNVIYVAPTARYKFNDRWRLDNTIITGWLSEDPIAGKSVSKELGYEWDISLHFVPRKGVTWINQAAFLFPGDAWDGGDLNYGSKFGFGLATKAAISF